SAPTAPETIRPSVDFPAPFSPTSACTEPRRTESVTPASAWTPPKCLATSCSSRKGASATDRARTLSGLGSRPMAAEAGLSPARGAVALSRRDEEGGGSRGKPGFPRGYPGHSALNFDAFAFVTTPPSGRFASTSTPPQPLPVLTALITHCIPS